LKYRAVRKLNRGLEVVIGLVQFIVKEEIGLVWGETESNTTGGRKIPEKAEILLI
jgi:hypothetical protein